MNPYLADADLTLYNGDALEVLRTLPDESVHMCVTSPPFYGLRDYGTGRWEGGEEGCDHKRPPAGGPPEASTLVGTPQRGISEPGWTLCGKCGATRIDQQIGLEPTPEEWAAKLVEVFREVRRVLRKDGTLWLEVGDSYSPNWSSVRGERGGGGFVETDRSRWTKLQGYKPKDLIGAPWLLAFALRADGWYLRSDIIWSRPNPMPESVTDRPTKSHSYVFLLSKSARYFFDQEAVREPYDGRHGGGSDVRERNRGGRTDGYTVPPQNWVENGTGRNIRSVWQIATEPYPEAHFATYPQELVRRCILAGTSERGCCPECGAPWVREVEASGGSIGTGGWKNNTPDPTRVKRAAPLGDYATKTLGWHPSCECSWPNTHPWHGQPLSAIPCTILDPFFGSGTTGLVARKHGRKCIAIELSEKYCELSASRTRQLSLLSEIGA